MTGFFSTASSTDRGVRAPNADFSGLEEPSESHGLNLNNEVWMGSTAVNPTGTHVNVMTLTSGTGIGFTYTPPVGPGFTKGTFTIAATGASLTDYHTARYIVSAGGAADGANYTTIATAYAAAVAAGAPQTVFVQPGTYTENLTLTAGINITAFGSDGYRNTASATNPVVIVGKMTFTGAGTVAIANVRLQTNSDFILSVTGVAASEVYLLDCYLDMTNNTGIQSTSTSSSVKLFNCYANLGTTGIAYFALSGGGNIEIGGGYYNNAGVSTTASTASAGNIYLHDCTFGSIISTSGTTVGFNIFNVFFNGGAATIITHNSTSAASIWNCFFSSGTFSAISVGVGATLRVFQCQITSSNTNAITGAGTINLSGIEFIGTGYGINTTTQGVYITSHGAYRISLPAGDYTVLATDEIVGVNTAAARAITLNTGPSTGQVVTIKDVTGGAAGFNITITPAAGTIDGAATKVINTNYGSVDLWYSGAAWFIK